MTQPGVGVVGLDPVLGHRKHAAGAGGGVVDGAERLGLGEDVVVLDEQQVDHEPDGFARGEVLAGGLVGEFGELADEVLEHSAHLGVVDDVGVQIDRDEFLENLVEQVLVVEFGHSSVEPVTLKDVADVQAEAADIRLQVGPNVVRIV